MKRYVIVSILVTALLLTGCTQTTTPAKETAPETVTIKFGGLQGVPNIAQLVARDMGRYEEAGIEFEHVYLEPDARVSALVAGDVDIAIMNPTSIALAIAGGAPIKAVGMIGYGEPWKNSGYIVALNGSGITKVGDLKGKSVAVSYPGDVDHIYLVETLRQAGVEEEVEVTFVLWPQQVAALVNGDVDAVQMIPYYSAIMDLEGIDYVVLEKPEGMSNRRDVAVLAASEAALKDPKKSGALRQFMEVYYQTQTYLEENPDVHVQYLVKYAGWKEDVAEHLADEGKILSLSTDGRFDRASVEEVLQLMAEQGFLEEEMPVESYMTEELLQ